MPKRFLLYVFLLIAGLVSACVPSTGYLEKDGSYVYATLDEGRGYVEHPITDIEVQSFQVLDKYGYAKDDRRVYYHEHAVQGADPSSFVTLSDLYGKDEAHVYYRDKTVPGADPTSFTLFDIQWGKDAEDVYFQDRPIEACDPTTFALLEEGWQSDSQCVYRRGSRLQNAEPASFVVLNNWFAKDKNNVYTFHPSIIEGADAATFTLREGPCDVCAEDKNGCYRYEERVDCE
jgi:hypothetical protein